jgi:hypothetical protein
MRLVIIVPEGCGRCQTEFWGRDELRFQKPGGLAIVGSMAGNEVRRVRKGLGGRCGRGWTVVRSWWVISILGLVFSAEAQNGGLAWAKRAGSNDLDDGNGVAVDSEGNVFTTGYFKSKATFGPGEANQVVLTSFGQDVFVAKYGPGGGLRWVRQVRSQAAWGVGVGADGVGNCYVLGYFFPQITFAKGEPGEVMFDGLASDLFLAKYDREGNFVWARKAGGLFSEYAGALAVDAAGNCYVTGRYGSDATFGEGEPNETKLAGLGGNNGEDIFVAKYDTNGKLQWAKSAGGRSGNRGSGIAVDGAGNSYVVGRYSSVSTFGPGEANETTLTGPAGGNDEIFVAKFGPNGNLAWVRSGQGGGDHDQGNAIAVDAAGNSVATGTFRGVAPFGATFNQAQLDLAAEDDIFVVKHDTDGNLQWVKMAFGPFSEVSLGVAMDSTGNAYITGYAFNVTFGAGETGETNVIGPGGDDIFLAKYDTNGVVQWARSAGGPGNDRGQGMAYGAGAVHVVGKFGQTATFGRDEANQTSLIFAGASDIFVAKFQVEQTTIQRATFTGLVLLPNGNPRLTITGAVGKSYAIQRSATLALGSWTVVGSVVVDGQGQALFEDTDQALAAPAFYRAVGE